MIDKKDRLRGSLKNIDNEIGVLNRRKKEIANELAQLLCPISVGDVVLLTRTRKRMQVTKIMPSSWGRMYNILGRLIKKDGKLGAVERDIWQEYTVEKVKEKA